MKVFTENSEAEIIIDLSDNDSISYYTSSEDELVEESNLTTHYWPTDKNFSFEDNEPEVLKEQEMKEATRTVKEKKRFSSGFNSKRENMTIRWTHDKFDAESDDDQSKKNYKSKPAKNRKKVLSIDQTPKVKKQQSMIEFKNKEKPEELVDGVQRLRVDEKEPTIEQPRVRRGLSQASKNQLMDFIKSPRPPKLPQERVQRTPSPATREVTVQKTASSSSLKLFTKEEGNEKGDRSRERQENQERNERQERQEKHKGKNRNKNVTNQSDSGNSTNTKPASEASYYEPLKDQLVQTAGGWILHNPSKSDEKQKKKESRSHKKPSQPISNEDLLEKVTPMMTQSGQMVLLTESGLCVPATPEMFQLQYFQSQQDSGYYPGYYPAEEIPKS